MATSYLVYSCVVSSWDPGGPFRYLTIWALTLSAFVAARVLLISYNMSDRRFDPLVSATAVINAMVVFLYWRLYFADPTSVTDNGQLSALWREIYSHALGPFLMWVDATFINRVFRRIPTTIMWLIGLIAAYVIWAETFVQKFNDEPVGKITSGLPYPFLNNLELTERAVFYGSNFAFALIVLFVFALFAWLVRRVI